MNTGGPNSATPVVVVGGGVAGAAAALVLAELGRDVALIDRREPTPLAADAPLDPRVVAISPGSQRLLATLGAWRRLDAGRYAPYARMQVAAGRGEVRFEAGEHGLDALGVIVEIPALVDALWAGLRGHRRVHLHAPAEIRALDLEPDRARLTLADGTRFDAELLIGADGARSAVRTAAGIDIDTVDYNQKALVTHLSSEQANPGTAWQRFTALGPLALLPLPQPSGNQGRSSLVWSVPNDHAERLMALDDAAFIEALNEHALGAPFGKVTAIEARHALPLIRRTARRLASGRVGLLGDAARNVHPLAGQGLNLGLADVAVLAEQLGGQRTRPDIALARYARRRGSDAALVAGGIHVLSELRGFGLPALEGLGIGFGLMKRSRLARGVFVDRACGLKEVEGGIRVLEAR
ncbi:NAD(P)-binding protein [Wenzhouxiangella sp. XN79A]|uniref:FAD-dependent oxidoreductase n=1 Tax=Wenzhouxiangella sp. XN79A TaxID=2724193 RepID=UPI00144AF516|nr:NAD(P)-binding protein [Wenzhouxiangella sp. XN79A]